MRGSPVLANCVDAGLTTEGGGPALILMQGQVPSTDRLLVVSGRVSFEIVQKAVAAGAAGIVAVSAPSSLAVDLARAEGLVLAGMTRNGGYNLYAGADLVD